MKEVVDISIWDLALGLLILVIPVLFFLVYRVRIVKDVLISVLRMVAQLALVAIYLEWIFALNSPWVNSLWVLVMIITGVFTTIQRVALHWKYFIVPLFIAGITSVVIIDAFFLGFVLRLEYFFDARYFIPITGIILGNALNHNIVGLSTYFKSLAEKSDLYIFLLSNTNDSRFALRPFVGEAVRHGLNPMIATMSVIGLITLPGMMTGQILGGSPPVVAIKYQIMIMTAIFTGCTINLFLSIILSNRFIFDGYGNLRMNMMKQVKRKKENHR